MTKQQAEFYKKAYEKAREYIFINNYEIAIHNKIKMIYFDGEVLAYHFGGDRYKHIFILIKTLGHHDEEGGYIPTDVINTQLLYKSEIDNKLTQKLKELF